MQSAAGRRYLAADSNNYVIYVTFDRFRVWRGKIVQAAHAPPACREKRGGRLMRWLGVANGHIYDGARMRRERIRLVF